MSPAKTLRKFLVDHGITQQAAADALHVSRLTLYMWLAERITPTPDNQADIALYTSGEVSAPWPRNKAKKKAKVKPFSAPTRKSA